jgi:hypothetical protein
VELEEEEEEILEEEAGGYTAYEQLREMVMNSFAKWS